MLIRIASGAAVSRPGVTVVGLMFTDTAGLTDACMVTTSESQSRGTKSPGQKYLLSESKPAGQDPPPTLDGANLHRAKWRKRKSSRAKTRSAGSSPDSNS